MAGPLDGILRMLGNVASTLAPKLGGAVKSGGMLLNAGKSITAAFASLKEANGGTAPADAEAKHDALFAKVKAHAESTFNRAEGG